MDIMLWDIVLWNILYIPPSVPVSLPSDEEEFHLMGPIE